MSDYLKFPISCHDYLTKATKGGAVYEKQNYNVKT